ncbi:Uma2 family endonuclease [Fimbriiglobus ruber]|uniref:Putative restriction endonuclease domain-containing protein n=1 Tax=Fimbriiglobus ruber TaxID=1908690 RepID=A0A225DTY5_9BACT|nr:Uma2 family endonuclease [Fimbriiglobus ruber]OWK44960.1 hypothetical protein FRUB_01291 [Fimbriiglobus ruber]
MATAQDVQSQEIDYPSGDGKPMAETPIHGRVLFDTSSRLEAHLASRGDVYIGPNMFVYYVEGDPKKRLSPDVYVAFGVVNGHELRDTFQTWKEGVFPSVVFEFTSKSTKREDLVTKFRIYQDVWRVSEYFLFDPRDEYLKPSLRGFRRARDGSLKPIKAVGGVLTSRTLGLTLSRDGALLLLKDAVTGEKILTTAEAAAAREREAAAREREAATRERERATRAEAEAAREKEAAARERERATQAEAEAARLRAELDAVRRPPKS